jgi:hypothetical protein
MRHLIVCVSVVTLCLLAATASGQAPQTAATSENPFAGRWELVMKPPAGSTMPTEGDGIPYFIIEVAGPGDVPAAKIVDSVGGKALGLELLEVSVKNDELAMVMKMSIGPTGKMTLRLKRVGDHLEGTATAEGEKQVHREADRQRQVGRAQATPAGGGHESAQLRDVGAPTDTRGGVEAVSQRLSRLAAERAGTLAAGAERSERGREDRRAAQVHGRLPGWRHEGSGRP